MIDTTQVILAHYVAANDYMATALIWSIELLIFIKLYKWIFVEGEENDTNNR